MLLKTQKAAGPEEISEIYGIPRGTLANWRCRKEGPRFYKRGRRVLYFLDEFEKWLKSVPVLTTESIKTNEAQ